MFWGQIQYPAYKVGQKFPTPDPNGQMFWGQIQKPAYKAGQKFPALYSNGQQTCAINWCLLKMGWWVKFISWIGRSHCSWGAPARPQRTLGISSSPSTLKFYSPAHFQKHDLVFGQEFLNSARRKNTRVWKKKIVSRRYAFWQKMNDFYFSLYNRFKGGTLTRFFKKKIPWKNCFSSLSTVWDLH